MRVIVCGGRDYDDAKMVARVLQECGVSALAHGDSRGADRLAHSWAVLRGIKVQRYPADWAQYGRRGGPIRNQRMLEDYKPEAVIAFPGGAGTSDMVRRAKRAGVRVIEVNGLGERE